jgi:tetraacyldisaccharide 4'-kinase
METLYMGRQRWPQAFYAALRRQSPQAGWWQYGLAFLWLLSQLYQGGVRLWAWSYTSGLRRRQRLPCRVVSIGNLTLGGTGKTPLTMWVARWYQQQGWRVAVLSRGYGGNAGGGLRVVSTGEGPLHDWQEVGDEPYLLACVLPGVPVLIGKNRYQSGLYACEHFGTQVLVLDDGFQHYALQRDLDIVLIDATTPLCQEALLPRGNLREPLAALQRADILVLTRTELAGDTLQPLVEQIQCWHGRQSLCSMTTVVETLHHRGNGLPKDVLWLQHHRVVAVAGIGSPEAFAATLSRLGSEVATLLVFPDHHAYTEHDWRLMVATVQRQGAACLITTTKDAVRFAPSWQAPIPVYILHTDVAFTRGEDVLHHQLQAIMPYADGHE